VVEGARGVAPTAIVHAVAVGAVVYSSATMRAVAAFLGIREQPCGAVLSVPWKVMVARVDEGAGAVPVVQLMAPAMFAPVTVLHAGEVPAAAPGAMVGVGPPAIVCGVVTAPRKYPALACIVACPSPVCDASNDIFPADELETWVPVWFVPNV